MKVILLHDIKGLGKKYDVKEALDGYVRNFLIPRKLVKPATKEALKELSLFKSRLEKEELATVNHLTKLAQTISQRSIIFPVRTDEKGNVFGSITKEMISKALRENHLTTKERVEVKLNHPLKQIGEWEVGIELKKGIKANLKVILRSPT